MKLLIIGAGSFSTEVDELAKLLNYDEVAFVDDNPSKGKRQTMRLAYFEIL